MSKKTVGGGGAGGGFGSATRLGCGTGRAIAVSGEKTTVTGMALVGSEGAATDCQG
jgi:hypothetical protein